jgi:hypothetical protein
MMVARPSFERATAAELVSVRTPAIRWAARLSITTIMPRFNVGTSTCST